jgi:hypothetical protein
METVYCVPGGAIVVVVDDFNGPNIVWFFVSPGCGVELLPGADNCETVLLVFEAGRYVPVLICSSGSGYVYGT